jgi:hypothetical protein
MAPSTNRAAALVSVVAVLGCVALLVAFLGPQAISGHGVSLAVPARAPVPTATKPSLPHDPVAASAPTQFRITGPSLTVSATVCQMPFVLPLDPPGEQHHTVCWVKQDFGIAPSSDAHGTSYVLGHAWAEDAAEVLNPLSIYVMNHVDMNRPTLSHGVRIYPASGMRAFTITLTTPHGVLTYTVKDAYAVAKTDAIKVPSLMNDHIANRVVLITCGVHDGQDIDVNVIVDAYLRSSVAT